MYAPSSADVAAVEKRLPFGLCAFSFSYLWGLDRPGGKRRRDAFWLIDQATEAGLSGVEFPAEFLPDTTPATIERARTLMVDRGLFYVADSGGTDPARLIAAIPVAKALGARVLRTTLSGILEGDRRSRSGRWGSFIRAAVESLRQVAPVAEAHDMPIGLENHQDVTSEELAWLCETLDSPAIGVTLDAANPMAVAEDPADFCRRIGPFLKSVHLKEYRVYLSPSGYRLVRCPVGDGVMDWPSLVPLYQRYLPNGPMTIELGAMQARHIRLFEDDFWTDYPPRTAASLAPLLRRVIPAARPNDEAYRTPLDLGAPGDVCERFELDQLQASVAYLRSLSPVVTRG